MIYFLYLFQKISLLIGLYLLGVRDSDIIIFLYIQIALSIVLFYIHDKLFFHSRKYFINNRVKAFSYKKIYTNFIKFSFITLFFVLALIFIKNGIPTLSDNPNLVKVGLSHTPILMRFWRFYMPILLVAIVLGRLYTIGRLLFVDYVLIALLTFSILLMGYKGYVLSLIIYPLMFIYYYLGKIKLYKIILLIPLIVIVGGGFVAYIQHINIINSYSFIFLRLTAGVAEGTKFVLDNFHLFNNLHVQYMNISNLFYKAFHIGSEYNINSLIFYHIHGANPYKMSVDLPLFMQLFIEFGIAGLITDMILEIGVVIWMHKFLFKKNNHILFGFYIIAFSYILHIFGGAGLAYAVMDLVGTTVIFALFFTLTYIFIKKTLTIKIRKLSC